MKKRLSVFLALALSLALILPAFSLADPELDFFDGYAHMELFKDGAPVMYMIYFNEDNTCYFVVQAFHTDGPGIGRAHVGTWEYLGDGYVYAQTGDNTGTTFKIIESLGSLMDVDTMQAYHPFSVLFK